MEHDNGNPALNPTSLTVSNAANLLLRAASQPVNTDTVHADLDARDPVNADRTISLGHYAAWLVCEMGRRD